MAKRNKKLTRREKWFLLFGVIAIGLALMVSLIASNASGKFDTALFMALFFSVLGAFIIGYVILSIPAVKGRIGEAKVNRVLKGLSKKYGGRFIHNVIVQGDDEKTSQIDHVYVCSRGVFVIETKNYAGRIYGTQNQKQWTQVLAYGHSKNKLYNPVMQNYTHIRRLSEAFPERIDMVSVVVFVRGNIDFIESENVYDLRGLKRLVKRSPSIYSESQVESIGSAIQSYKDNPVATAKEHVHQIKATQKGIEEGICPRCGGQLVLRTSKKDGRQFYGCSNYPNCKFTKQVD